MPRLKKLAKIKPWIAKKQKQNIETFLCFNRARKVLEKPRWPNNWRLNGIYHWFLNLPANTWKTKVDCYTLEDVDFIGQKTMGTGIGNWRWLVIYYRFIDHLHFGKKRFSMWRIQPFSLLKKTSRQYLLCAANIPWCRIPCGKSHGPRPALWNIPVSNQQTRIAIFLHPWQFIWWKIRLHTIALEPSLVNEITTTALDQNLIS